MRRGLLIGIAGWLLVTVLFRLAGRQLMAHDVFLATYLAGGIVFAAAALVLCRFVCEEAKVVRFGAGLTVPGLLGNAAALLAFRTVFPNISAERADEFGALMLWAYGLVLASILLFGERVMRRT